MHHHTKNKGDVGVLKAQADLAEQGYMVLLPLTEHSAFDLVIYKKGAFQRVQVKYRKPDRQGRLFVKFSSIWSDKNGVHVKPIDKGQIDLLCVYCPSTNECYYLNPAKFKKSVSLRVKASKNGQQRGVHLASDYRNVP
jgi:hypothetical protein